MSHTRARPERRGLSPAPGCSTDRAGPANRAGAANQAGRANRAGAAGTILVTDAGRGSALAIIRSLARARWRVVAADSDRRSPGFHSRFAHDRLLYPDASADPSAFTEAIRTAVAERDVDLVIPVTDETLLPLSAARHTFDGLCRLALPEAAALDVTINKQKTLELARALGVPVPRTALVTTLAEARAAVRDFSWPVVLKPLSSRRCGPERIERFEVAYARDLDQLSAKLAGFEGRCPVLLQEYISGTGYGVEMLAAQGNPLAAFQHRRLREVPISGGASSLRESVPLDPGLFEHARNLLAALEWTGLAMVEFKVGRAGPRLMEINGRVWGSLPLAVASGMDFPARLADLYLTEPAMSQPQPDCDYRTGVRVRNLELDVLWIGSVLFGRRRYPFLPAPSRWRALPAAAGLLNPFRRSDVFSLRDPAPGLADLGRITRKLWTKLRRR